MEEYIRIKLLGFNEELVLITEIPANLYMGNLDVVTWRCRTFSYWDTQTEASGEVQVYLETDPYRIPDEMGDK